MKLKFCLIIICLLIFGCKSNEEPSIKKSGYLTEANGAYSLEEKETNEIYELVANGKDAREFFSSYVDYDVIVWGEEFTEENIKKISVKFIHFAPEPSIE